MCDFSFVIFHLPFILGFRIETLVNSMENGKWKMENSISIIRFAKSSFSTRKVEYI